MNYFTAFKSEEELSSHLKLRYQQAVEDRSLPLLVQVQNFLSVVKTFIKSNSDVEVSEKCTYQMVKQLCEFTFLTPVHQTVKMINTRVLMCSCGVYYRIFVRPTSMLLKTVNVLPYVRLVALTTKKKVETFLRLLKCLI